MLDQATDTGSTGDSSLQTVSTTTGEVASTQAPAASTPSADTAVSGSPNPTADGAETPPTVYTPDYKFKAANKEHEIDEWLRPAIKSPEHEKKLKEIYEKAFGIDEIKQGREKAREEYKAYRTQTEPVVQTVTQAAQLYNSAIKAYKDGNSRKATFQLDEAFKHLGIKDEVLQQYVFQKLQAEEMDPREKQHYNHQRELELANAQMQQQMQEQQAYFQQIKVQTRTQELNQATSKPEVASIVQSFDQRNGPDSFKQEVISRGRMYWEMYQQDKPAHELVQEIINKYGLQAPPQEAPPQAPAAPKDVPVIPVIKGNSGSPAGRQFNSLDDIKAYRKQQYGS
jgi:hypothetical protein